MPFQISVFPIKIIMPLFIIRYERDSDVFTDKKVERKKILNKLCEISNNVAYFIRCVSNGNFAE